MKKLEIMNKASRAFGRAGLKMKKYSPEILVVTGVVGTVASAVMACKATTKLDTILAESKETLNKYEDYVEEHGYSEEYTEADYKNDIKIVKVQSAVQVAKLYAPAVGIGVLSITAILAGHNITRKRNVALAAAYTAVDNAFKDYRGRVIERFGKELDRELRYNIKTKEVEEVVKNEDGTETVVKKKVNVVDEEMPSLYARFFDETCKGWTKDHEYNLMALRDVEKWANIKLQRDGYLFLNQVYESLGIPRTKAGQVVGWIYDEKNPNGDNRVELGIYDIHNADKRQFVNGHEPAILIDPNVDGEILDLI